MLITGQMRSGTAAVAEAVHALGIPVAVQMHAPVPPTYRMDWEDADLSLKLAPLMFGRKIRDFAAWFGQYLKTRSMFTHRQWGTEHFAIKSPLLPLVWPEVAAAVPGAIILHTRREQGDIDRSVRACFRVEQVKDALACNERIQAALEPIEPTMRVIYERLVVHPESCVEHIAGALGVSSKERIEAAVATVKEPRPWP